MKTKNPKAFCKNCPHWEDREILKPPAGDGNCLRFPPVLHSEYDACDEAAWFWPITGKLGHMRKTPAILDQEGEEKWLNSSLAPCAGP